MDMTLRQIARSCGISPMSTVQVLKQGIQRHSQGAARAGRPRKITAKQEWVLIRNLLKLREENPSFTLKDLMEYSGVNPRDVSEKTVNRILQRNGFFYSQARKRGLLNENDIVQHVCFANVMKTIHNPELWTNQVAFYLDGVFFAYKSDPLHAARARKLSISRRCGEGLSFARTAKGQKEDTGGKLVKMYVAISHNEAVILCETFEHLTGAYFASLIEKHFDTMFIKANKNHSRIWLQDNDPCQNSRVAKNAMTNSYCDGTLITLPCRSPDLNPIENFFHLVRCKLK